MGKFGTLVYKVHAKHIRKAAISSFYLEVHQKTKVDFWIVGNMDS